MQSPHQVDIKKRRPNEENTHKVSHFPCLKITAGFTEKIIHYIRKRIIAKLLMSRA